MDFPQLLEAHYWKLSDEAGETIMRFYRSHPKTNGTIQIVCSAACVRLCVTIARIASHAIPTDRVNAIAFKNISSNGSIWRHEEIGLAVSFGFDAVAPVLGKQRKRGKKKNEIPPWADLQFHCVPMEGRPFFPTLPAWRLFIPIDRRAENFLVITRKTPMLTIYPLHVRFAKYTHP